MWTVAKAFSRENNILPLDGCSLDKHIQQGEFSYVCRHLCITSSHACGENVPVFCVVSTSTDHCLECPHQVEGIVVNVSQCLDEKYLNGGLL